MEGILHSGHGGLGRVVLPGGRVITLSLIPGWPTIIRLLSWDIVSPAGRQYDQPRDLEEQPQSCVRGGLH